MCGYRVVCAELAAVVCCKHSDFGRLCRARIECNQRTQRSAYEIMRLVVLACNGQRFVQLATPSGTRCQGEHRLGSRRDACRRDSSASGVLATDPGHNSDAEGPRRPPAAPPPSRLPHDSRRGEHCPGTPHDTTPPPRTAETRHETGCSSSYIIVALTERSPRQRTKSARFHAARNGAAPPHHRRARRRPGDPSASAHGAPEEPRRRR